MNKAFAPFDRGSRSIGFNADEFLRMIEMGAFGDMRVELVGGELQKMSPAFMNHGECNAGLLVKLADAYRGSGYRLATDLVIQIDDAAVRAADIAVTQQGIAGNRAAQGSELVLVVEISDASLGRDLGDKLADYAWAGIQTYWVVDVKGKVVHVMTVPVQGTYAETRVVRFDEPLEPPYADGSITID